MASHTLSETQLENSLYFLNPLHAAEHLWSATAHLPIAVSGLICVINAILLTMMSAWLPKAMNWQLPEESHYYPIRPWNFILLLAPALIILFDRHQGIPAITLLLAMGSQAITYTAITDYRDRWIPDHIVVPMLLIGLLWHPLCNIPQSINGVVSCTIMASMWFIISNFIRIRTIEFSIFSGGDILMAATIGSWFGPAYGTATVGMTMTMIALLTPLNAYARKRNKMKLISWTGYDPETRTIPVGPMFAAAFMISALTIPDPMPDLTPIIEDLKNRQIGIEAAQKYLKEHPAETAEKVQKKMEQLEKTQTPELPATSPAPSAPPAPTTKAPENKNLPPHH